MQHFPEETGGGKKNLLDFRWANHYISDTTFVKVRGTGSVMATLVNKWCIIYTKTCSICYSCAANNICRDNTISHHCRQCVSLETFSKLAPFPLPICRPPIGQRTAKCCVLYPVTPGSSFWCGLIWYGSSRCVYVYMCGPGSSVGTATDYGLDGPRSNPGSCTMVTGSFPGVKCGRGVLLTTDPF